MKARVAVILAMLKRMLSSQRVEVFLKFVSTPAFARVYGLFSVAILLATTLFWSLLGAHLQSGNADQLVNPYLFEHSSTFRDAVLPGAHTFLIKWPLFELIKNSNFTNSAYSAVTVGVVLTTVAALVAILYRIERRPLVFGTICLALASVLLLVPAVPYAGGLLPLNMAMLTTRNLEYILYIIGLAWMIRWRSIKRWRWLLPVALLALLMASDRLFFDLSAAGALLALVAYSLSKGWNLVTLSVNWLLGSIVAVGGALGILWLLSSHRITHIASLSSAGPYGLVHTVHDLILGTLYGGLGLLTNFGANPAWDATIVKHIPHTVLSRLIGVGGLSFLVNLVIFLACAFTAWHIIRLSLQHNRDSSIVMDESSRTSVALVWTALAAFLLFVFSSHYYAVDARYLTITLFAGFIALTTYARDKQWSIKIIAAVNLALLVSIGLGSAQALSTYHADQAVLEPMAGRNSQIVDALKQHPVQALVGDYWRVVPIRQHSGSGLKVMPLSSCFAPRGALSSQAWQVDLNKNNFAYLLSLDRSLSDFPRCNLDQVIANYGRPNASFLIAGSLSQPKELLLFYDRGVHKSAPKAVLKTPSTVLPIAPEELPYTSCLAPTVMNIVAHQDDDLLFLSPDLIHDIQAGRCIRTIYITAGDAGSGQFYWLSRQQGSEAAYTKLNGYTDIWVDRIVKLNNHEYITVSNPRGNSKISLIFMHLPDGNTKGQGFSGNLFQSLAKLDSGRIALMNSVDNQSTYSSSDLTSALSGLMHLYQPAEIRTQSAYAGRRYPDHSDHNAVSSYVKRAYSQYESEQFEGKIVIPIKFYLSYPAHERPENVVGSDLQTKADVFITYGQFDPAVCHSLQQCLFNQAYNAYLRREYTNPY